jgi:hypothetical protein
MPYVGAIPRTPPKKKSKDKVPTVFAPPSIKAQRLAKKKAQLAKKQAEVEAEWAIQKAEILLNLETQTASPPQPFPHQYDHVKTDFTVNKIVIISDNDGRHRDAKYAAIIGFTPGGWLRVCDLPEHRVQTLNTPQQSKWDISVNLELLRNATTPGEVFGHCEVIRWNEKQQQFVPNESRYRSLYYYDYKEHATLHSVDLCD